MGETVVRVRRRRMPRQEQVLLTVAEAAERLRLDEATVRRYVAKGIIPFVRLGDGGPKAPVRVPLADLDEWWQGRRGDLP